MFEECYELDDATLGLVHSQRYLETVKREVERVEGFAELSTGDVTIDASSNVVARRAAGSAVRAYERTISDGAPSFALVRPPGHHALPERGMGFCLFNNVGVVARHARACSGKRIAILDIDYHHGNGTQALVGDGISYISSHAWPAYPGSGSAAEQTVTSSGDILLNLPIDPRGISTEGFVALWDSVATFMERYVRPEVLLVSAGFDYVRGDPVGDLGIEVGAARDLARIFARLAASLDAPLLYVLEGGYNIDAIASSILAIAEVHSASTLGEHGAQVHAIPAELRAIIAGSQERYRSR